MSTIRIVQYFELVAFANERTAKELVSAYDIDTILEGGQPGSFIHRYQNYFVNQQKNLGGKDFAFAPFQAEGTVSNIGGDNTSMQILFPNVELGVKLVEQGNGNRLSRLELSTVWLNENNAPVRPAYAERYIGVGASFSETTIELRFKSAMDSVVAKIPARALTRSLVGILPLNSDLRLR